MGKGIPTPIPTLDFRTSHVPRPLKRRSQHEDRGLRMVPHGGALQESST
jgi:hypothetical protein